ncbi:MAG: hypothetical protein K2Y01_07140 [Rhabdochlamydiaceae bacterium]|nr:hypothetical protein [Rhabdochlamydiaceae bacterium]
MLIKQGTDLVLPNFVKNGCAIFFFFLFIGFFSHSHHLYGVNNVDSKLFAYYLYVSDLGESFIEIPSSNVSVDSSTLASRYLAGIAPVYNANNVRAGKFSGSFLVIENADGIFADISNNLSVTDELVVSWSTPTKSINLELDSIINSMVVECRVAATTKVGSSPFFGQILDLAVTSDGEKIYFQFSKSYPPGIKKLN